VYNSASGANIPVDALTGAFSGLAIDSYAANIAAGSHISVTSTLTFYADPASIDTFAPDLDLIPGGSLPGEILFGTSVPEPSTAPLGGTALVVLSAFGWLRRRRQMS
jgi:MYXO-CTERM domain-containing protein